jgi:hypothetical protein
MNHMLWAYKLELLDVLLDVLLLNLISYLGMMCEKAPESRRLPYQCLT